MRIRMENVIVRPVPFRSLQRLQLCHGTGRGVNRGGGRTQKGAARYEPPPVNGLFRDCADYAAFSSISSVTATAWITDAIRTAV